MSQEETDEEKLLRWSDQILDLLEERDFKVVGDSAKDCCFWACNTRWLNTHQVRSSHWRHHHTKQALSTQDFLAYVGARATSKDVHWPITLSFRPLTAANYRKRSYESYLRRTERKASKGVGPWAEGRPSGSAAGAAAPGRAAGSAAPAAAGWSSWGSQWAAPAAEWSDESWSQTWAWGSRGWGSGDWGGSDWRGDWWRRS